ncbi:MAG: DNA recombination protein RmuC [Holosporales bacterium]
MESVFVLGAFVLGAGASFALAWNFVLKNKVSKAEFDALSTAKQAADTALETLKTELKGEREKHEGKQDILNAALQTAKQQLVKLETEKEGLAEKIQQHKGDLAKMEETFRLQFENLANRIFDEKSSKFKKESEAGLGVLLNPLKEKLQEFKTSLGEQAKEQFSLKNEIQRIILGNEKITVQAERLTNALKSEAKTQGNWGEMVLEKVLEASGLRKGSEYNVEVHMTGEEGNRLRPDVIIDLPENRHLIVDAKVSLTHYERYFSEADEAPRAAHLKQFLASVRTHITGLGERGYQNVKTLGTPDFVLMFIPIEGAYALALQQDSGLQEYAWNKKVVLVCPATLFATLRTVASVWRIERQAQNHLEIAKQGEELYKKISGFVTTFQNIGSRLVQAQESYDKALGQLATGKGNVLSKTQQLAKLGVKTDPASPIPALLAEHADDVDDEQQAA